MFTRSIDIIQKRTMAARTRTQTKLLLTCCMALFIVTLDNSVANVALPDIQRDLGASAAALEWIVDAYVIVRGSLMMSAGAIADRIGRRRLFRIGLVVFALASLACSLAPSAGALIAFRIVQALGGATLTPSTMAIIADAFPERGEYARALGVWSATIGLATAAGPLIGGILVGLDGWRTVFWVNVPIVVVALLLTGRNLRESKAERRRALDVPGQLLLTLSVGAASWALIAGPSGHGAEAAIGGAIAILAGIALVVVENHRREPLLEPALFRIRAFSGGLGIAFAGFLVFNGFLFFNSLYLQQMRGYSALAAGLLTLPATAATLIAAPLSGRIDARLGPRAPVLGALSLLLAAMAILAFVTPTMPIPLLLLAYLLLGAGIGLINAPLTHTTVSAMPRDRAGVASGAAVTARQLGNAFGVALLGVVAIGSTVGAVLPAAGSATANAAASSLGHAYLLAAAIIAVAIPAALWTLPHHSRRARLAQAEAAAEPT
jgi:EmrB/QacA subfamily drug resistance transporter